MTNTLTIPPYALIIGENIAHSKSPAIHNSWLKQHNLPGSYGFRNVSSGNLREFVLEAWEKGYRGFNATIPHKEALLQFPDLISPDPIACAIGAINTVYRQDGSNQFIGTNTDAYGWWKSLELTHPPKNALVIGAGGAAKAVIYALKNQGVAITITNRKPERAAHVAGALGFALGAGFAFMSGQRGTGLIKQGAIAAAGAAVTAKFIEWMDSRIDGRGYDLIVNCTSCGTHDENPIRLTALDPGTLVSDLVYTPLETQLLKSARELGGVPIDGLGMLLHQAAGGFEKWFGVRPEVTEDLRRRVLTAHA